MLETFNTRLSSHSLHKGSYRTKQTHEEATTSEKLCSFNKEEFERLFGVGGVLNGDSLCESICVLFGLLTKFKEEVDSFDISISFDEGVLSFLGMLGSSKKAMLWAVW